MLCFIEICLILLISFIIYLYYKLTFWKRQNIPNIITHNVKAFKSAMHLTDQKCFQKYGNIIGTYELLKPVLLVADPSLVNKVLINNFRDLSDRRISDKSVFTYTVSFTKFKCVQSNDDLLETWVMPEKPLGLGIFLLPYSEWKKSRSIISHGFSISKLRKMCQIIEKATETFTEKLESISKTDKYTDMMIHLNLFSLEVALKAFFGIDLEADGSSKNRIIETVSKIAKSDLSLTRIISVMFPKLTRLLPIGFIDESASNYLIGLTEKMINERRKSKIPADNVFQYLLEAETIDEDVSDKKLTMNKKEVIDNCLSLLIAGYETSSATLGHFIHSLALNPLIQEKLIEEIDEYLKSDEPIVDMINKMPYLNACLNETLRLYPPATRIERKAVRDFRLENIFIAKNSFVTIPTYSIHRDPNNYENANEFIPERFLPENSHKLKSGTFVPFADGPRNCVGMRLAQMEIKLCIVQLLTKFRFAQCHKTKELQYPVGMPLLSSRSIFVKVIKRVSNQIQ